MFYADINKIPDKIKYTNFEISTEMVTSTNKLVELLPDKIILSRLFDHILKEAITNTIPVSEKILNYRIPEIRVLEASAAEAEETRYELYFVLKIAVQHRTMGLIRHEQILHAVPIIETYVNDRRFEEEPNECKD